MSKSVSQTRSGITLGGFRFAPGIIPTIATLLMLTLLVNLGLWQLRRSEAKEAIVQRLESRSNQSSRDITSLTKENLTGDMTDFPIMASGHYLNEFNLLLDNRTNQGQPGYEVLSAFLTDGKILLVNRGWIAQGPDRSIPPLIPTVNGELTIEGHAHTPNPDFFVLKEDDYSRANWPFLIQKIDLEKSGQLFDDQVLPFVLRLNPDKTSGFVREWHSYFMGPEKHYGYAVQWFSLAIALLGIYLVVNTHRQQKEKQ